jgi:hypothetical protein
MIEGKDSFKSDGNGIYQTVVQLPQKVLAYNIDTNLTIPHFHQHFLQAGTLDGS